MKPNKSRLRKPNLQQNGTNKEKHSSIQSEKDSKDRVSLELVVFRTSFAIILVALLVYGLYMYSVAKTSDSVVRRTVVQRDNGDSFVELDSDIEDSEDGSVSSKEQQRKSSVKQEIPVKLSESSETKSPTEKKPLQPSKTDQSQKSRLSKGQNQNGGKSQKNNKQKTTTLSSGNVKEIEKEVDEFKATYLKKMSPKKIFVDGRRLPPVELLPQKPNNSSVR